MRLFFLYEEDMKKIIECVPNFSEGRDRTIIDSIVSTINETRVCEKRVKVLKVDSGEAVNRTVVTFVGEVDVVVEAAFRAVKRAAELIDMRKHHGTHPRLGATDVLPLIPLQNISLEECAQLARQLAQRIYDELGIACYLYEAAALRAERKNLAVCRRGEYERLKARIEDSAIDDAPDIGPDVFTDIVARSGATNVGAREFLVAVNFNIDSPSKELAHDIACEVREKGRKINGEWHSGILKGCKAIGWFIPEYGYAQVSMNICDTKTTPYKRAYEVVCEVALRHGTRVTGVELIGVLPEDVMTAIKSIL